MIHAYDELQLKKKNPVVSVVKLNSTVAYIREKFFDLRVVPVAPVIRDGNDGIRFKYVKNRKTA